MKDVGYMFWAVVALFYLYFTIKTQIKIVRTIDLNKNQKVLNSIFLWLIPFLWGLLVKTILKDGASGTVTKDKRKVKSSHYYESNMGGLYSSSD